MTTALSASTLKGDTVRNKAGEKLGILEEFVLDIDRGRIAYAVLASGGFLGMGERYFAIPWDLMAVDTDNKEVVLDVDKTVLADAPGFDKDDWPDMNDLTWVNAVYQYYGRDLYWEAAV